MECTPQEGERWREQYSDGYSTGRGDVRWGAPPRIQLITVPGEMPGETGAEYVARHVGRAWEIGYTRAYQFDSARAAELAAVAS
jgi:hypothetical protein